MDNNMDDIGLTLVGGNTRSSSQATTLSGWNRPNSISLTTPNNQIVSADSSLALTIVASGGCSHSCIPPMPRIVPFQSPEPPAAFERAPRIVPI